MKVEDFLDTCMRGFAATMGVLGLLIVAPFLIVFYPIGRAVDWIEDRFP